MTPVYVVSAALKMLAAFMFGGAVGVLLNVIAAIGLGIFDVTLNGEVARIVMGSTAVGGVIVYVAAIMLDRDQWLDLSADNGRIIGELRERLERVRR